ncbi:MAG: UDP-N-acetylmuramoyl-L-alanyl-D-glutamate--2,6-diaminopimelate ligase, partial [Propionibacteriales bacterium]|nr:UDP-N-acetylmuramoyl-L-alanyl-D-glutamate--2,6-diaminopimelate ligase [Propionibacteriales bacterium]
MATKDSGVRISTRPSSTVPVSLDAVAEQIGAVSHGGSAADCQVTGVAQSSRAVRPGDIYVARVGGATHGARFLGDAVVAGAVAWLTDTAGVAVATELAPEAVAALPAIVVDNPARVLGSAAALVYGNPADALTLIGVTGTHGKTTTTQLLEAGLSGVGRRTAVIGTMGTKVAGRAVSSTLTTPEAPDLHALFAVMREQEVEVCVMEVSSHALAIGRVDGVVFDLAVFTNFGRDHLDFHHSLEEYFAVKASLLTPERARRGLVNIDDEQVATLLEHPHIVVRTYSTQGRPAVWRGSTAVTAADRSTFVLDGPGIHVETSVALPGDFNVANAVCALAAIGETGGDVVGAAVAVGAVSSVPGRMESIARGQDFAVIVDYAHKPDAIAATLAALRRVTTGRLVIVVGAGGDRDGGKRPMMGEVSARLADVVIVTDDNPRGEDPAMIREQLLAGARGAATGAVIREIADRESAISAALRGARADDTVLVAG